MENKIKIWNQYKCSTQSTRKSHQGTIHEKKNCLNFLYGSNLYFKKKAFQLKANRLLSQGTSLNMSVVGGGWVLQVNKLEHVCGVRDPHVGRMGGVARAGGSTSEQI